MAIAITVGALVLSGPASADAALQPERLDLGDTEPGRQAYNFQEAGDWRTWALSGPTFAGELTTQPGGQLGGDERHLEAQCPAGRAQREIGSSSPAAQCSSHAVTSPSAHR